MFKKTQRLSQTEFANYFKIGTRHHFKHLLVITAPAAKRKVAVAVGKKVAKRAVQRNVLRRRIYATVREMLDEREYQGVLIVIPKPAYQTLPRKTAEVLLRQAIAEVLKSA